MLERPTNTLSDFEIEIMIEELLDSAAGDLYEYGNGYYQLYREFRERIKLDIEWWQDKLVQVAKQAAKEENE